MREYAYILCEFASLRDIARWQVSGSSADKQVSNSSAHQNHAAAEHEPRGHDGAACTRLAHSPPAADRAPAAHLLKSSPVALDVCRGAGAVQQQTRALFCSWD